MRTIVAIVSSLVVSLAFFMPSFAAECYTDLDCTTGNRCVKQGDDAKGTCFEGSRPPKPAYNYGSDVGGGLQRNTKGKICWGNKDCDPGQECVMKSGQMFGTCR
jgi:hypothetical protein